MKTGISLNNILIGFYLISVPVFSYSTELHLNNIPQMIGMLLVVYAIYDLFIHRKLVRNNFLFYYTLFTLWCLVTYVFAQFQSEQESLITLVKVTIITAGIAVLVKNRSDFILSLIFFFFSIFIICIFNYKELLLLSKLADIKEADRFAGTFANSNIAALYGLSVVWSGCTLLYIRKSSLVFNMLICIGLFLAGFVVLYSGSRKGILGLGLLVFAIAWISFKMIELSRYRKILLTTVLFISSVFIFYIIYNSPFFFRLQIVFQGDDSAEKRIYMFYEALTIWSSSVKNALVGVGLDNFRFYSDLRDYSHSTISEVLACTGLIGFILYFTALFSIFFTSIKAYHGNTTDNQITLLFSIVFLLLVMLCSFFNVLYAERLFCPLLGMISSYIIITKQQSYSSQEYDLNEQ